MIIVTTKNWEEAIYKCYSKGTDELYEKWMDIIFEKNSDFYNSKKEKQFLRFKS